MKKSLKVFAVMLVVMMLAVAFAACTPKEEGSADTSQSVAPATSDAATTSQAAEEKLQFAWSPATLDNPYFITVTKGFQDRCAELGIDGLVADPAYDAATQYSQFETWIGMGVDAISACPVDTKSLEEVTTRAQEAGIVVVGEAQGIANADANVIVDDYGYGVVNGEAAAKWINEKLGGEANVLLLCLDHVEAVILRGNGMNDKITELTNATIVARQSAQTIEEAMNVTETMLQAHPEINVISCVNDQLALGAWQAVQNMGIKNENFYIGGADYTDEAIAAMNTEGSYFRVSTDIQPLKTGADIVDVMLDYVKTGPKDQSTLYFDMVPHWQDALGWN